MALMWVQTSWSVPFVRAGRGVKAARLLRLAAVFLKGRLRRDETESRGFSAGSLPGCRRRDAMGEDRTRWSAWEYADALNRASAAEVLELAQEVNAKWDPDG